MSESTSWTQTLLSIYTICIYCAPLLRVRSIYIYEHELFIRSMLVDDAVLQV